MPNDSTSATQHLHTEVEIVHFLSFYLKGRLQFELKTITNKQTKPLKPEPIADVQNENKLTYLIMLITHREKNFKGS